MKTMCPPGDHPQWLCGNSCTWAHDVQLIYMIYIVYTHDICT